MPDWFPGAGFKRKAKAGKARAEHMASVPFEHVKSELVCLLNTSSSIAQSIDKLDVFQATGHAYPSITSTELQDSCGLEHEEILKWSTATMYGGKLCRVALITPTQTDIETPS